MRCAKCRDWMVEFNIHYLSGLEYEGHICPTCGRWIYKKEQSNDGNGFSSQKSVICLCERGRGMQKTLDNSNIQSMVEGKTCA